jgi:hypothetical protein
MRRPALGLILLLAAFPAYAGEADVVAAKVDHRSGRIYDFDVTVRSNDSGWDRYADRIEILGPDGKVLGIRVLEHPHEQEQPFTRDVSGVEIPRGIDEVTIRARFKPVGFDGAVLRVKVPG